MRQGYTWIQVFRGIPGGVQPHSSEQGWDVRCLRRSLSHQQESELPDGRLVAMASVVKQKTRPTDNLETQIDNDNENTILLLKKKR